LCVNTRITKRGSRLLKVILVNYGRVIYSIHTLAFYKVRRETYKVLMLYLGTVQYLEKGQVYMYIIGINIYLTLVKISLFSHPYARDRRWGTKWSDALLPFTLL
jgi:hypothetical protein